MPKKKTLNFIIMKFRGLEEDRGFPYLKTPFLKFSERIPTQTLMEMIIYRKEHCYINN